MGTRAAFWIGDPRDLENREWLGCIAWDGYEWAFDSQWAAFSSEQEFRDAVSTLEQRDDFAHPGRGWPFPWDDDIFLTDYTYAFFDGKVWSAGSHHGLIPIADRLLGAECSEDDDPSLVNIPAPEEYNPAQPDSIILIGG